MSETADTVHIFQSRASELMNAPVRIIHDSDSLAEANEQLMTLGISALAVVDRTDTLVGVITRTDLLRAGRTRQLNGNHKKVLTLPDTCVRQVMTPTVEIVSSATPLHQVARRMLRQHIHRVFVSDARMPTGVLSATEMMRAVANARVITPIGELMHAAVTSVNAADPLSIAVDRVVAAHHSGVVVLEDDWPVGTFGQADALAARDAPNDDRVDRWMDTRIICAPLYMPAFRAAEQLIATRAQRLLAVDSKGTRGILTGMDFVRYVAEA